MLNNKMKTKTIIWIIGIIVLLIIIGVILFNLFPIEQSVILNAPSGSSGIGGGG